MTIALALLLAALVVFLIDAFSGSSFRFNLTSLGLALLTAAMLAGGSAAL